MERVCSICGRIIGNAPYYSGENGEVICMVGDCFEQKFWRGIVREAHKHPRSTLVINGRVYTLGEKGDEPRGYGGKPYRIECNDGRIIVTNNLWYQGIVPQKYLEDLPNNARFV